MKKIFLLSGITILLFVSCKKGGSNSGNNNPNDTLPHPPFYGTVITVAGGNDSGHAANQLNFPGGVHLQVNGDMYITDLMNNRIQFFPHGSTSATNGVTVAGGNGVGNLTNQLNSPFNAYVDAAGNIYIADAGNHRVQKWAPNATTGVTIINNIYALSVTGDSAGDLYVSESNNNSVLKYAPNTTTATVGVVVAGGNGPGAAANQLHDPISIFVDGNNDLYIADLTNNRVQKFTNGSTTATNGITVAGGNGAGSAANSLKSPIGVFVDVDGNVYVADSDNERIQKWAPGATIGVTVAGGNGTGSGMTQFNDMSDVSVDASGNIFVADSKNNRIQEWKIN